MKGKLDWRKGYEQPYIEKGDGWLVRFQLYMESRFEWVGSFVLLVVVLFLIVKLGV